MEKYNVIIIGAGPAGSFLANKLKQKNLSLLILEKKKFPRYKPCAGGISKKAYDILYSEIKNIKSVVEKTYKNGLYVRNNKFTFVDSNEELIYMTYRSKLDNFIVKNAVNNKTIFLKDNITIKKLDKKNNTVSFIEEKKEKNVNYDVLVGAWGNNIGLNKTVNLYPFSYFDLSSSWEGPISPKFNNYYEEYSLSQIIKKYPGFVCYIFPKKEKITAGIFTSKYPIPNIRKNLWNDFIRFWKLDKNIKPKYAIIPIRNFNKPIAKDNIILVGDAAGLADPFTGEGIYYALISAIIASKNIENYFKIKNYDLEKNYNNDINFKLYNNLRWAGYYRYIFNKFPNFSFWFGSETSLGNYILRSLLKGEIKYNEIQKIIKYPLKRFFIK